MCGRFALDSTTDQLIREFVAAGGRLEDWTPTYSIAPTTLAPIVLERPVDGAPSRELELAKWDWPKPPGRPAGAPIINARIEKLAERFWVGAFSSSRALIPMGGYLEWTGEKGDKQPHYLHGDGVLAAAGLAWTIDIDGRRQRVFVVITREARDASGEVHDRMPAFVDESLWDEWLSPEPLTIQGDPAASRRRREALLEQLDASSAAIASTIRTHLVDRRVNNSRTVDPYDPTLIEPLPA